MNTIASTIVAFPGHGPQSITLQQSKSDRSYIVQRHDNGVVVAAYMRTDYRDCLNVYRQWVDHLLDPNVG